MNLEKLIDNLKCGKHSGFRLCDIIWFSFIWIHIYNKKDYSLSKFGEFYWIQERKFRPGTQYISCPICIIFFKYIKPIKLKRCKCSEKYAKS